MSERHHTKSGHLPAKKAKKRSWKLFSAITGILVFILLICGVGYGSYYYVINDSTKKYETDLKAKIKNINSANSSLNILNADKSLITDKVKIKDQLSKTIAILETTKNVISTLIPTDKYIDSQKALENGIQNNIDIFKQLSPILASPESSDVETSVAKLNDSITQCINSYKIVTQSGNQVSLPQNITDTLNTVTIYIDTISKLKKDQDLFKAQSNAFINDISTVYTKFASNRVDFSITALRARNGTQTYDSALNFITKTSKELESSINAYNDIKFGLKDNDSKTLFSSLKTLLDGYDSYIKAFNYALTSEKAQAENGPISDSTITSLYSDSTFKYSALTDTNNIFIQKFNDFKMKIEAIK